VVLINKPPYGTEEAFAGLRLSLAMLVSGVVGRSTCILMGDGTLNALADQDPGAIAMPSNVEAVTDLEDFEGEVYCVEEDLVERMGVAKIIPNVKMVSWERAREIIKEHDLVTTF
jgi:tRNA 2-thiouridine synthesizing protein C